MSEPTAARLQTLLDLASIPTATGKEDRVIAFIDRWIGERPWLAADHDAHGNMLLYPKAIDIRATPSVLMTGHLDHPAFVVERVEGGGLERGTVALSFRGGVKQEYFDKRPRVAIHAAGGVVRATIEKAEPASETTAHRDCVARLDDAGATVGVGDVCVWDLPHASIDERGMVHAPACDDLAAVAAALCAMDESPRDIPFGLLLTRAEETGFVGAIGACRDGFIPASAKLLALENSRSFAHDSPIGGGPIVRVGDRMSTFSPSLTAAVAKVCERLAKEHALRERSFRWQRKLMPGGACEATCYCAYGYDATCVCLPLGNYHNMGNLDEVERGEVGKAEIQPERISVNDYLNLVDLLVACATGLEAQEPIRERLEKMFEQRRGVLG